MYTDNFSIKVGTNVVKCNVITLNDYIKFLFAKSSDNSDLIKKWMTDILKSNTSANDLNKHESELVIVNLLSKSLNETTATQEYECECGNKFNVDIDTTKAYINYSDKDISELYAFKNFKILFKYPELFADDNVPKMIVDCIDSIFVGDDRISITDLNDAELDDLYSAITPEDMERIRDILLGPKIQLAVPVKCPKCGKSHVHVITGFKEFIRIIE